MSSRSPFIRAYIGLGSNLASPLVQVRRAFAELAQLPESRLLAVSRTYRSRPMGPADQPDYINAVVALETRLAPLEVLDGLQAIEQAHLRKRGAVQWGPRTLDLDLLLYGDVLIDESRLIVPHAGIKARSFVLQPLLDIDPALHLPDGQSIRDLLDAITDDGLEVVAEGTP